MWHQTSHIVSQFSDLSVPKEYGTKLPVLITDLTDYTTSNLSILNCYTNVKTLSKNCVSKE